MTRLGQWTAAGAALTGAGLLFGGRHPRTRSLLLATGLAGLGASLVVKKATDSDPVAYHPTDTLKTLAPGLWIVDSGPLHGLVPLRMTVIRLPDGGLLLHSPTPPTAALMAELDAVGPVRALVAPNPAHWMSLPAWQRAYPGARTWAAPGLARRKQVLRAGVVVDEVLSDVAPAAWEDVLTLVQVPGGFGFTEVAFFHKPSGTLVLTDLALNLEPSRIPAALRSTARWLGITAEPVGRPPFWFRAVMLAGGRAARLAADHLRRLAPVRVVMAHGRILEGEGASAALNRSLRWLLPTA